MPGVACLPWDIDSATGTRYALSVGGGGAFSASWTIYTPSGQVWQAQVAHATAAAPHVSTPRALPTTAPAAAAHRGHFPRRSLGQRHFANSMLVCACVRSRMAHTRV